jgi:hypothetical protein
MIAGLKRRQSYTLSHKDIGTSRYGYDLAIDNIACIEFDGGGYFSLSNHIIKYLKKSSSFLRQQK